VISGIGGLVARGKRLPVIKRAAQAEHEPAGEHRCEQRKDWQRHHRSERAEHGDQRKGAQSGFRGLATLAFEPDQKPDAEAGQEVRQMLESSAFKQAMVDHALCLLPVLQGQLQSLRAQPDP